MASLLRMFFPLIIIIAVAYSFRDTLDKKGWVKKDMFWKTMILTSIGSVIGLYIADLI
jgi:hypothetical protein